MPDPFKELFYNVVENSMLCRVILICTYTGKKYLQNQKMHADRQYPHVPVY